VRANAEAGKQDRLQPWEFATPAAGTSKLVRDKETPACRDTRFLDGLRGLAALYVLARHATRFLCAYGWQGRPERGLDRVMLFALKLLAYPHAAVLFFFVLSGFVIHLRFARQLQDEGASARFEWRRFMWKRVRRLYPPLLLAIAITGAIDAAGLWLRLPVYSTEAVRHNVVTPNLGWVNLLGNLLFLAFLVPGVSTWGTDAPLWSLTYEWWFYVAYPAFWLGARRSTAMATALVAAMYAFSFFIPEHPAWRLPPMIRAFPVWWMGALLAEVCAGRLRIPFSRLALLIVLVPLIVIPEPAIARRIQSIAHWMDGGSIAHEVAELATGLSCVGAITLCFAVQQRRHWLRVFDALRPLGDMSYTLYVIHFPIIVFIGGWLMSRSPGHVPARNPFACAAAMLGVIGLAYIAHLWVERPFTGRRRRRREYRIASRAGTLHWPVIGR
jgi:peptidoglycan/LPS O-acetylase OafA/YrhL